MNSEKSAEEKIMFQVDLPIVEIGGRHDKLSGLHKEGSFYVRFPKGQLKQRGKKPGDILTIVVKE